MVDEELKLYFIINSKHLLITFQLKKKTGRIIRESLVKYSLFGLIWLIWTRAT